MVELPLLEALWLQISPRQGGLIPSSRGAGGRRLQNWRGINQAEPVAPAAGRYGHPRRLHILISCEQGSRAGEEWPGEEMTKMPTGDRHDGW